MLVGRFLAAVALTLIFAPLASAAGFLDEAAQIPTYRGQHAFCFRESNSTNLRGHKVDEQVRLASVTKLLTSLWAINKVGPDHRFTTNIYYKASTKELYIDGNGDPYFGRKKAYGIMSELIKKNITSLNKVYLSKRMDYFRDVDCGDTYTECSAVASSEASTHGGIPIATQLFGLKSALNPARWNPGEKNQYILTVAQAKKRNLEMIPFERVSFQVGETVSVDRNPFAGSAPPDVVVFQMQSAPIHRYIKHMNTHSINWVADKIFQNLGGLTEWQKFVTTTFGYNSEVLQLFTGSGLNIGDEYPDRKDNYATCRSVVEIMSRLDKDLNTKTRLKLEDLMMVAGVDQGTFLSDVYSGELLSRAVVAKTGTLKNVVSLTGFVRTQQGVIFFGMFFQTMSLSQAKAARDRVVQKLVVDFGGPVRTNWQPDGPFLSFDSELAFKSERLR